MVHPTHTPHTHPTHQIHAALPTCCRWHVGVADAGPRDMVFMQAAVVRLCVVCGTSPLTSS
eukprot:NODE_4036_length_501_cov_35.285398_g3445_i0.p5 GENE.NODE_4036_length_501_cov_35.285398_g3445_i0~~NODE_4036_length_501_cov_35.285398_g3445_i0.p5  ORF type:complete len:61 (-),score=10.70 NODE_4036_length_501_cov_35.285398_g3445_i0:58-240(-)